MKWLRPLSHFVDHPVTDPACPAYCCYREYCSPHVQQGINPLLVNGKLKSHRDCFIYQGLAKLTKLELDSKPPDTASGFMELVVERVALAGDA